tara:strand:+ start:1343 stop:2290 length:948 start_codon:yes stop_codon:yes gene_type:complete
MAKEYVYSEIFNSVQGEGQYTGIPTAWIRFYLCNLQCDGFGQKDPTDPSTYKLPYKDFDVTTIKKVEDLPVWEYGCDSSYTWSKKYKHLMHRADAKTIVDRITDALRTDSNPDGTFLHPLSRQSHHLAFTGGEPLMKHAQEAAIEILDDLQSRPGPKIGAFQFSGNQPLNVTWETNGTRELTDDFINRINNRGFFRGAPFFSVSPKLYTVSGESPNKAIKPEVVREYQRLADVRKGGGQLKFVVGPKDEQWEEFLDVVHQFRKASVNWPVWVMPTGATVEEQEADAGAVAKRAYELGFNVSARVHTYLFGNAIGT